jgi:drug/metabolite transporter (DMT)-like permease
MSEVSTTRKDPGLVALSTAAFHLLLLAYPARFRREYGPHMTQAFRDCCLRALRQAGPPGMLRLWSLTLVDWLKSVIEQHLLKGVHMSKARFIRISGWALILGAAALLLAAAAAAAVSPASSQYDARYRSTDPFFQTASMILFPSAVVLISVGIAGLNARYGEKSGRLGRLGLILGVLGGVATIPAMFGLLSWSVLIASLLLMFGGLLLFGLTALQKRPLPRGNYLPVIAGLGFPAIMIASDLYEAVTGTWLEVGSAITLAILSLTALALLRLGQILRGEAVEEPVPAI